MGSADRVTPHRSSDAALRMRKFAWRIADH
jgi:hypothetical protein